MKIASSAKKTSTLILFIAVLIIIAIVTITILYSAFPKLLADMFLTADDYAENLVNTVENMDLPYEIKINLLQINDSESLLNEINKSLDDKISKKDLITREQCAYMTDFFIRYLSIKYETPEHKLTRMPDYITKSIFENRILRNISDESDMLKINAYYSLKDINSPYLTEQGRESMALKYPITLKTAIYVFDYRAYERERKQLLERINKYNTITDVDVVKMYMEYGLSQRYEPISLEPLYLENLPDADSSIEKLYVKTTLADTTVTQVEYDSIINEYTAKYATPLFYRQLTNEITDEQKLEIQTILSSYPEIVRDIADKYEKFDEAYNIPIIISDDKFDNITILDEYYKKILIDRHDNRYEFILPPDNQIVVYKLRHDLTEEEKLRMETYGFTKIGKHSAAFLEIYPQSEIGNVSSWAKDSFEIMLKTGIMTNGTDCTKKITWTEAEKIMKNIVCGVIVK